MKALLTPVSVALVLIAVVLAMLGHLPLAGICAVAWVGSLALNSMRSSSYERLSDPMEVLDADSRALFLPVRRLVAEIQDKVANYPDVPMIKAMGPEVIREALRIQEQVAQSLTSRTELRKVAQSRSQAEAELQTLLTRLGEAATESERASCQAGVELRQRELAQYELASEAVMRIETGVRQSMEILTDARSRLAVVATEKRQASAAQSDLRATIANLRSLNVSYDEAQSVLSE